ncbi:MAG: AI-2E family transporter [Alphaproteobacteria bacterium]|nr:AI-2E family transporter [Alphaproteobacteria bacterium]
MTLQRQATFWIGALVVLIFILWSLQNILLPFIAGFVLAYFLDPVADKMESWGLPRIVATALILASAILLVVLAALLVVPVVADQMVKLIADLPMLTRSIVEKFNEKAPQSIKDLLANSNTDLQGQLTSYAGKAALWFGGFLGSIWTGGWALLNVFSLMIITPIVAFYLLADWDRIVAIIDSWLPRQHVDELREIARDIDKAMSGFIRGQGTVCLLLGVFYATGLSLVGLKSGMAIGFAAGFLSFIPYVGALIGGMMAIGVGLVQFWPNEVQVLAVLVVFLVGQFIEGNFLSPKLVGGSIGLHPVWMMFALLAFSYVFGFLGLLLAVPLAAATGVFVRYGLRRYLTSNFYTGHIVVEEPTLPKIKSANAKKF